MKRSRGDSEVAISTKIAKSDHHKPSQDCIDLTLDSDDPSDPEEAIISDGQPFYNIPEPEELDEDPFKNLPLPPEPSKSSKPPKTAVKRPPPPLIKIKFSHILKNQTKSKSPPDGASSQPERHLEPKAPTAAIQRHLEGSGHQIGHKEKASKPRGRPPKNSKDDTSGGSIPMDIWEGETEAIECDEVTTMRVCPGNKPPFALCGILLAEAERNSSIAYLPNTNSIRCQRCYFEMKVKGKEGRRGLTSVEGVVLTEDNHFGSKVRVHLDGERHKRAVRAQQIRCRKLDGKWDPEVFNLTSGSDSE